MERKHKLDLGDLSSKRQRGQSSDDINPWSGLPYSARYHTILETRQKLPVYQFKDDLISAVSSNQFVVVEKLDLVKPLKFPNFLSMRAW